MSKISYANVENFDSFIKEYPSVIVDFWGKDCVSCKLLEPVLEEVANDNSNSKIKFLKVNVDECPSISSRYRVMGLPTLLFLKNGKPDSNMVGNVNRKKIEEKIKEIAN